MTASPLVPDTSTRWTLWHIDLFDRNTPDSIEAEGTNILHGLYQLWRHTLREGAADFSTFRLAWGDTVTATATVCIEPSDLFKLQLWSDAIGEDALLRRIAKLHLAFLQKSSRWTSRSVNAGDEARELLSHIGSLKDPSELGSRVG